MQTNILFLGLGKMGSAIMHNFLKNNIKKDNILTIDPISKEANFSNISQIPVNYQADIVIFAIKPQNSAEIIANFKNSANYHQNTIFISILAGKTIDFFENILGNDKKIIRLMPNLPILINQGISAYFSNKNLQNNEEKLIINLFGDNIKLDQEEKINQATAISGSGPAYLFSFAKNMIAAARTIGLNQEEAEKLAIKTILGSANMLVNQDNLVKNNIKESDIDNLINNVTSKGGTTKAALDILQNQDNSMQNMIEKAADAAFNRAKELSS